MLLLQVGAQVVYSKYAGTEVELNDYSHLVLKEDDIIGILEADDVKDMKPLNDRVLIKVTQLPYLCLFQFSMHRPFRLRFNWLNLLFNTPCFALPFLF